MPTAALAAFAMIATSTNAPTKIADPVIARVSMFKNGYAFVTRVIPASDGTAEIVEVPRASLGTLWFLTDDDATIESVETATDIERTVEQADVTNIPDLLRANVGKRVSMLVQLAGPPERVVGKILSLAGNLLTVETDAGEKQSFNVAAVQDVRAGDLVTKTASPQERERRFYRVRKSKPGGNVVMIALERGLTWAPAYAIDLTDPKKLTVAARATVMNDVYDLKNVPTRLITGFPNLPYASILDPISSGLTVDQWLQTIGGIPAPAPPGRSGGRAREMMAQNAYAPMADAAVSFAGIPEAAGEGEGIGDLFFYDLKEITLAKNARQSRNLFRFSSEYRHVYTWNLDTEFDEANFRPMPIPRENDEVWHTIEFVNPTKQPLTTAVATIFQKGELTGQTMLTYIPAGAKAETRINKALDVTTDRLEEETNRERAAIKDRYNNPVYDLVTIKGTLKLTNRKGETISTRVTKELVGTITSASDGAKLTKLPSGLGQVNPRGRAVWTIEIKPGEEKTLTYEYTVYVRS